MTISRTEIGTYRVINFIIETVGHETCRVKKNEFGSFANYTSVHM